MKISELARAAGIDVDTIRYYEKIGVLSEPPRHLNGYRVYSDNHLARLNFVCYCRTLDISLADIKSLIELKQNPDLSCEFVNQMLDEHIARVRQKLRVLHALEHELVLLQGACGENTTAAQCGILEGLSNAACRSKAA